MRVRKCSVTEAFQSGDQLYEFTGMLVFTDADARENNLFGSFVEEVWKRVSVENLKTSFVPTHNDLRLYVNARTQDLVDEILVEALRMLKDGFKHEGCILEEII